MLVGVAGAVVGSLLGVAGQWWVGSAGKSTASAALLVGLAAAGGLALALAIAARAHSPAAAGYAGAFGVLCLLVTVTDVATRTIPNRALTVAAILWLPLWWWARPGPLAAGLLGAAVCAAPLWLATALRPGDLGWGDVKLAAILGLYLGFPESLAGLLLGAVAGGVGAAVALVASKAGRRATIPYAPFLVLGALVALLWGSPLLAVQLGG